MFHNKNPQSLAAVRKLRNCAVWWNCPRCWTVADLWSLLLIAKLLAHFAGFPLWSITQTIPGILETVPVQNVSLLLWPGLLSTSFLFVLVVSSHSAFQVRPRVISKGPH